MLLPCACACPQPAPAPVPVEVPASSPTPAASTAVSASAGTSRWVGTWTNGSCGERNYPRVIEIESGGSFRMTDRVSPCPPGARCVWSGLVVRKGSWTEAGGELRLGYEPAESAAGGKGAPAPERLRWEGAAPVEGEGCAYQR